MTTLSRIPDHFTDSAAARAAPTSPPISACDDDDGSPKYQVIRFQAIAPISAAKTTCSPPEPVRRVDDPAADGGGDLGRDQRADEVHHRRERQGDARGQRLGGDRDRDGVGGVVEAVGVVERQRDRRR